MRAGGGEVLQRTQDLMRTGGGEEVVNLFAELWSESPACVEDAGAPQHLQVRQQQPAIVAAPAVRLPRKASTVTRGLAPAPGA